MGGVLTWSGLQGEENFARPCAPQGVRGSVWRCRRPGCGAACRCSSVGTLILPPRTIFALDSLCPTHCETIKRKLLLNVGPVSEDIMLYGQGPCSPGRSKPRRVCYLGLLGPATNGQCDITALYAVRFGQPSPGRRVFIVTCQEKNGWQGQNSAVSALVPPGPALGAQ
jgi:hypothetical protein